MKYKTLDSRVSIPLTKFNPLLTLLKTSFKSNEKVQQASSVYDVIVSFGWRPGFDPSSGRIITLNFIGEDWVIDSTVFLTTLAKFVEDGSFIKMMAEAKKPEYFVYRFIDGKLIRKPLSIEYIDYSSKDELKININKSVFEYMKLGEPIEKIHKLVNDCFARYLVHSSSGR
jgi:hypothetical protein